MVYRGRARSLLAGTGCGIPTGSVEFSPLLLVTGLQLIDTVSWLALTYRESIGCASKVWKESEYVKQVRVLNPAIPVASDAPDVIYTLAGRRARMISRKMDTDSNRPNEMYDDEFAGMKKWLRDENGALAYSDRVHWRWDLPSKKETREDAGFPLVSRAADGAMGRLE